MAYAIFCFIILTMSLTSEIILWTISLLLALLGISFGIIASRSATQANKAIRDMISNSIIVEESQKLFFDGLKNLITQSKKVIKSLKTKDTIYYDYSIISANTRIHPIAPRILKTFIETEYNDVAELYVRNKKFLDEEYLKIIKDFSILKTDKKIDKKTKEKLIEYHNHSIDSSVAIIKLYTSLAQATILKTK